MEKNPFLDRLATRLAWRMVASQGGDKRYLAVYEYYALGRLQRFATYGCVLAAGFVGGLFWHMAVYLLCIHYLKGCANGYHASSFGRCFVLSCAVALASVLAAVQVAANGWWALLALPLGLAVLAVCRWAPIQTGALRLTPVEAVAAKGNARRVLAGVLLLAALLWRWNAAMAAVALMAVISTGALMLAAKLTKQEVGQCGTD